MMGYILTCLNLFYILLISGCATTLPPGAVTVIQVDRTQIPAEAVRNHWPDGRWSVYLSNDARPEVLDWELDQIRQGTEWDRI